jgi:Na+/melibiose symporter-like transporter
MWFTYLLIFLKDVQRLSAVKAGGLMLIGQLTQG